MTARRLELCIPGDPVAWSRARHDGRSGRFFNADRLRFFQDEARIRARVALAGAAPIAGAITLSVRAFLPIPESWPTRRRRQAAEGLIVPTSRPDADNFAKAIADALNRVAYRDDAQVVDLVSRKRYAAEPRLEVVVEEWRP
jgi:Holliday junction resolvase RusA-like endonuclease